MKATNTVRVRSEEVAAPSPAGDLDLFRAEPAISETVRLVIRITLPGWRLEIADDPADAGLGRSDADRSRDRR